jgi:hypothetical protein
MVIFTSSCQLLWFRLSPGDGQVLIDSHDVARDLRPAAGDDRYDLQTSAIGDNRIRHEGRQVPCEEWWIGAIHRNGVDI